MSRTRTSWATAMAWSRAVVFCWLFFAAGLVLVHPSQALAENEDSPNSFWLEFDLDSHSMYGYTDSGMSGVGYVHLTLNNVTVAQVYGWEASIDILGTAISLGVIVNGDGQNTGDDYNYRVSYSSPFPCSPSTHLATIVLVAFDSADNCIGLFGVPNGESATGLAIEVDEGQYIEVLARVYEGSNVAAQFNGDVPVLGGSWLCEDVVSAENYSFGSVKSLYR